MAPWSVGDSWLFGFAYLVATNWQVCRYSCWALGKFAESEAFKRTWWIRRYNCCIKQGRCFWPSTLVQMPHYLFLWSATMAFIVTHDCTTWSTITTIHWCVPLGHFFLLIHDVLNRHFAGGNNTSEQVTCLLYYYNTWQCMILSLSHVCMHACTARTKQ